MQPRLMRSRNEVIIAGVCGGIGEYFAIDPVIIRLIFVLVTLTSGIGIIVYPILWAVMPKTPAPAVDPLAEAQPVAFRQAAGSETMRTVMREPSAVSQARVGGATSYGEPLPPEAYKFDPWTGQPIDPNQPAVGETVSLQRDPTLPPQQEPIAPYAGPQRRRGWPVFGIILVGIGLIALAEAIGFPSEVVFPILMIAAGVLLLRRR